MRNPLSHVSPFAVKTEKLVKSVHSSAEALPE